MFRLRKGTSHFILQLIFVSLGSVAFANDSTMNILEKEKAVLDQLLTDKRYDARIRPSGANGTDGPVVVRVNFFVRNMPYVDDLKQEYSVQLTFRYMWLDERLQFDDMGGKLKYLHVDAARRIWMPDLFFSNEKQGNFHNMLAPNFYVRIFPSGSVLYSTRISLTLDCPMNLQPYPFDRHECPLQIASYGYLTNDVIVQWKEVLPIQVINKLSLEFQGFTLTGYSPEYCSTKSIAPEYSCLKAMFSFKRDLMPSLTRIYIPNCVLVLASFVSFWLDPSRGASRAFLVSTTLLAMVFQVSYRTAALPTGSYIKAVDIWLSVCLAFIFGTLLQFATLNYTSRNEDKNKCEQAEGVSLLSGDESKESTRSPSHYKHYLTCLSKASKSKKIDIVARIMFPTSFAVFNLAYWIAYLHKE
ncbi:glutamate-gated chloride channel-like [Bradysia coprophila]|uniref:glutamate-gated chloride channel-like n=1 Tax=Bradysia coprophila TaxID=38358 RepID=UPI00187DD299|nr:glutamate-gated chloride channel-like [Bradysia coprophila]XP_037030351.1 glutamate-gated chloride channel-like [Bradysia coprophila]